jgi:GntR family transcriptional regulator
MNRFLTRPLYLQLRDALVERIANGQWKPGSMVPNESELAREFGVSPGTMRKALDLMETMRLLTRRQGRGTFVSDPSADELAARYNSLRRADGGRIADEVRSGEIRESGPSDLECARLRLSNDDRVYRLHRRCLHDNRAYMVEDVALPVALFPGLADAQDPSDSVTSLARKFGVLLGKAEERISIGEASLEVAEALGIASASPILVLDRVVFTLDGRPAEWRMGWCHVADKFYLAEMN